MLKTSELASFRQAPADASAAGHFFCWAGVLMARGLIEIAKLTVDLTPRPIEPSWILEGKPEATWCILSQSADGLATTMVWHCTAGKFDWFYDFDETVLILDGAIVLESDGLPRRATPPAMSSSSRTARMRNGISKTMSRSSPSAARPSPVWFGFALRVFLKLKKIFMPASSRQPASLMAG